jgi:hypothetical protein
VTTSQTSSSLSTGGAGTFFERDVDAYWLAQLLLSAIPPILIDTQVIEVSFQTEHLGWKTDDLLITCEGAGGVRRKLAAQVKRSFTVSASDEECSKAILDFYQDFKNPAQFSTDHDRLVLIVQRGTDTLLGQFGRLLDCARASRDGADFAHRLANPGFISKKAVHFADEIRQIVGAHEGRALTHTEIWPFLKLIYLLSLDLDTATRQVEGHLRSLLAYTATERDGPTVAAASWSALQGLAESSMKEARSLRREDLPAELKRAHNALGVTEDKILRALKDHTAPILRKIRSTVGPSFHLARTALVQQVMDQFESTQVIIVSGAAGSGKSATAKEVLARLSIDHFTFAFRAEEFAKAHIDETLQAAQVPGNSQALAAVLAPQARKIILIESMERLLERSTRDAFSDLIAQVTADADLRLLITCRDYSTEQVRESFLRQPGLSQAAVLAPPLDDAELDEIAAALPQLARPLGHPPLRKILRNPFILDKALEIPWSAERPLPESEREFRREFWRDLVRVDRDGVPGLGRRREQALQEIAIRRARALSEYVPVGELDSAVVASLKADSLIISPESQPTLIATAHDVLEDWAILEWFEEQHLAESASFAELATTIGTHPAIRRSYRKWVTELLEREPGAADRLFLAATTDAIEGAQFRDDTLVSILRAELATDLLARHETALVANDCAFLKRVIHLLRVACVAIPEWARGLREHGSVFNVPEGPAWGAVLNIVHDHLPSFPEADQPLLIGLIEDAVRGVSWWAPAPEGEPFIAGIAYALLSQLRGWRSDDARSRVLKIIAKIPKADPAQFEAALRGTPEEEGERDRVAEELQDLLLTGTEGMPAVRDLPQLMVSVAAEYLLATEEQLRREEYRHWSLEVDLHFGVRDGHRHEFSPASALRGPWLPLLRQHPLVGLKFYYQVFNHSIDWYVHPRLPDPLEPAWKIELTFADGTVHKQWANPRLWNAYRGLSVSPYALQSMLMALETWLPEVANTQPVQLDKVLLAILRRSQSAALSAVVASVAIAHPHLAGETLLVLLSARDYLLLDRQRMAQESQTAALTGMFPHLQPDKKIYDDERKKSNGLPHRARDLENAISNLQLGPLAPRVHALLDHHLPALPDRESRSREDLLWELALKRMDLRQYSLGEPVSVPAPQGEETEEGATRTYVPLEMKPLEPDVQALVDEGAASLKAMNTSLGPWMWATRVLKGEATPAQRALWRERLGEARAADRETEGSMGTRNGPGCVAAVCVRDQWSELLPQERAWCIDVVCSEILRTADRWSDTERIQRHDMAADRRSAGVIAGILTKVSAELERAQVRRALAAALIHPVQEVSWFAAWSVDASVWQWEPALALRCANAIALHAQMLEEQWENRDRRPWTPDEAQALFKTIADQVRQAFEQGTGIPDDAHATLNLEARMSGDAHARILTILAFAPTEPASVDAFERASRALVKRWDDEDADRGRGSQRDFESEMATEKRIQQFALHATPEDATRVLRPILDAVHRHADEIDSIVQGLTIEEDRSSNLTQYWYLWELFATEIKRARWLKWLDRKHATGRKLLATIFMTQGWKDNVRHWKSLEGHAHRVDVLFEALPRTAIVLDNYLRFLYHIGAHSLPQAFTRIATALRQGVPAEMLALSNTVFLLEVLLQRHVYGRPLELKQQRAVREAVLYLLDILVERGSSAAFRMRDDFVTPMAKVAISP